MFFRIFFSFLIVVGTMTCVALASPKEGDTWTDPATSIEFLWVSPGCFQMGQTAEEKTWLIKNYGQDTYEKHYKNELPRHEVCVDGFWMSIYEVTRGQFRQFVQETGYLSEAEKNGKAWVFTKASGWQWKQIIGYDWRKVGYYQDDNHPVTLISWNDANAFIAWLSGKSGGHTFRLPTEAQWEYAARAGSSGKWFWAGTSDEGCKYANVADTTAFPGDADQHWPERFECADGYWGTAPVGTYRPNSLGLHDMTGNVWEWCSDVYAVATYSNQSLSNPRLDSGGLPRVYRGGSWDDGPRFARSAVRTGINPDGSSSSLGFRIIRTQ